MVDVTRGPVPPGMIPPVPPAEVKDVELYHPKSWITKYVFSQDAKIIALQYASTALSIGLVALVLSWLMRLQLGFPGYFSFIDADHYYQFITMHGMIMVIYLITALFLGGFGNYLIPLMLGARDMVFPYLNMLSYWVYLLAVLLLASSFFAPGGPTGAGWTLYPPQAVLAGTPGRDWGIILMLASLILFIIGFTMGGLNYVVTVLQGRTRGMTLMRMPLTVWGIFTATVMALLAFPALFVAAVMMLFDRIAGTSFFMPSVVEMGEHLKYGGGSPILFQHLFWFFGHPEVYIVALPAFGIVSDLISTHARKNIFGYRMMVWAIVGIGALSFVVWAHHMYVSGMNPYFGFFFAFTTLIIAIPTAIKVYNWVLTLWQGDIHLTVPMLFALGFIVTFVNGGLTGLFLGNVVVDVPLSDTMFVVAHFHMVMGVAPILVIFGAIYHWYPKITGRMMDDTLGRFHFWVTFVGAYAIFFPMHYLGLLGVPRRYYAMGETAFIPPSAATLNVFMTVAALIVGFAQMVFLFNLIRSLSKGRPAGGNPWGATTLEWQTPQTPPTHGNWGRELPVVYRWAYDYSVPGADRDFVPQNQPTINWVTEPQVDEVPAGHALDAPSHLERLFSQPMEGPTGGPTIRNPVEWGWDQLRHGAEAIEKAGHSVQHTTEHLRSRPLTVRRIQITDLKAVLIKGFEDFGAYRTDVIFLCIVYPIAGLIFARMAFHYELIPLLFPLASGFALIGPFAAVGLYEMSRRRELALHRHQEVKPSWTDAFGVMQSPNFGGILILGLALIAIFLLWLAAAWAIYHAIHGPQPQESIALFIQEVLLTPAGWWLIIIGCGVGFLFALLAMVIGVASFPILLDRDVGLMTAVWTSFRVVAANPKPMAAWGCIVAAGLILGSIPLFIGLVVVLPVLGHATWHLYRKLIASYPTIPFDMARTRT